MTTLSYYHNINSKFLKISGKDSASFIQDIITNDINECSEGKFLYSCILNPQGRFIADFFIYKKNDDYFFEINKKFFEVFIQKLNIYKLRSKITITKIERLESFVFFKQYNTNQNYEIYDSDPRSKSIGMKLITSKKINIEKNTIQINDNKYHEILIKNKIPYSVIDLEENKSLLLENNFDNINAISWDKGCYVGQEITARMKYRALLKKQIYNLEIICGEIEVGNEIKLNNISAGKVVSKANNYILCMLKIELVKEKSKNKDKIQINNFTTLKFL
tara:strand:- start:101 stop:928 length:828 start_codon:yes stop_codon:yes gene_type:complete